MSPRSAIRLSLLRGTTGGRVFPEMTASGGMLAGIPAIASASAAASTGDSLDAGVVWLIDADALVVGEDAGATEISLAQTASVTMETEPDSPSTATTVLVSM
jgi:hypothetical protein